ncbi:copper homeostasis protein CutC [Paradevosia shaoguanensis]|uniref:copper homeostasis protein CutC n=1 Tax=Paradevosia shaoguanensis TaxID=1335043 RepID=UPI003C77C957
MTKPRLPRIEVCVEGIDGLLAAQKAGADRVELCASLLEGGLTPSIGVVREALKLSTIPFNVIVRPRGGDFLYSEQEFQSMLRDVEALRDLGVAGVVIGCLTADGRVDIERTRALVRAAKPLTVTFHRAFDMTVDYRQAVEDLVHAGVDRVLTSGQRRTALDGLDILKDTVALANGRLVVMVCGGLNAGNIADVLDRTGAPEAHFSAGKTVPSGMAFLNPFVGMGGTSLEREYQLTLTDESAVRATIAAARVREVQPA